jgi:hypothetical protein
MITQQEYDRLKALHRNIAYTQEEMNFLIKVAKENVDPNVRVCPTCNSSISDFKQKLYGWFLNNEEEIIKSFSEGLDGEGTIKDRTNWSRALAQLSKLLGLDAPDKTEITHKLEQPLFGPDEEDE